MQILPHGPCAGARGQLWRVARRERPLRGGACIVALERVGARGVARFAAMRPFEAMSRLPWLDELRACATADGARAVAAAVAQARPAFALERGSALEGELHPWQLRAALAFARGHSRVLVADDVGMGKTVTAAYAIAESLAGGSDRRCLVLAPAHLTSQWVNELSSRVGIAPMIAGSEEIRRLQRRLPAGLSFWSLAGCVLASMDYVKQPHVLREARAQIRDLLVIDEAHLACGDSERHAAALALAGAARHVLLLTATPADGAGERIRALRAIGAGDGSRLIVLRARRAGSGTRTRRLALLPSPAVVALDGALAGYLQWIARGPNATGVQLLAAVLQRRALSSAHALAISLARRASLLGRNVVIQPSLFDDDDSALAIASGMPAADERDRLDALHALAADAARADRKVERLRRFLARVNQHAIVFTCFRDTAEMLARALGPARTVLLLHGELAPGVVDETIRRFTMSPRETPQVLVATDMASQGLNLHQRCRLVVHFDLPWRPAAVRQRNGRVDRLGQTRRPHALLLTERTRLAAAELERFDALEHEMTREEAGDDEARRWQVLAGHEAARIGASRGTGLGGERVTLPLTAIEVELLDGAGSIVERSVVAFHAQPGDAIDLAHRASRRRVEKLRVHLAARARWRIAREESVLAHALRQSAPLLRQHGLFERRAERMRDDDAAAREATASGAGLAMRAYRDGGTIAAFRARVIAVFERTHP